MLAFTLLCIIVIFWLLTILFIEHLNHCNSLAIAKEGELSIGTIDDIQKLHIRTIPLGEHARRICHQEQSRTFAICSLKNNQNSTEETETHFVRLLDDQSFDFISTYALDTYEYGCSIISCSFSDDNNVYYCVGTAYVLPEENEPTKVNLSLFVLELKLRSCVISYLSFYQIYKRIGVL